MSEFKRTPLEQVEEPTNSIRGNDVAITDGDPPELSMTLEKINDIVFNYLSNIINPTVERNDTVQRVPVIYADSERWKTVRADGYMRDPKTSMVLTPVILLHRSSVSPQVSLDNPSNKYIHTTIATGWNSKHVYDRYSVLNNIKPSKKIYQVVIPDYMDIRYTVYIWTDFQSQMDDIVELLNVENHEFWGERNDFKFRVTIDGFDSESQLPASDQRMVRMRCDMRVAAYLIPERMVKNMKLSSNMIKNNTVRKLVITEKIVNDIED
jgi:hypothetical protein